MDTKRVTKNIIKQERKRKIHRKTVKKYPKIIEHIPGMIYRAGTDWIPTICGEYISVLTGYTRKELTSGKVKWLDIIYPEDKERVLRESAILLKNPCDITQEYRVMRKDGKIIWVQDKKISYYEKGKPKYIEGIVLDITERKKAEEALWESEDKYRILVESSPYPIFIYQEGVIKYANQTMCNRLGWTFEEMVSPSFDSIEKLVPQRFKILVRENRVKRIRGEYVSPYEISILTKYGLEIPVIVDARSIMYDKKPADQVILVDITERKKAEKNLEESESRFKAVFENAGSAIFIADTETGNILDCNKEAEKLLGRKREEIIGMHQSELHPEAEEKKYQEKFALHVQKGHIIDFEGEVQHKDGRRIPVLIAARVLKMDDKNAIMGVFVDITEPNQEYKTLTENSLTGIFIHQDKKFVFVNDRFAEMHGYKPGELLEKDHLSLTHPDEREKLREIASKRLNGETVPERYEVRRIRKNGETIWCEMMATRIQYRGRPAIMGNIVDITERKNAEQALKERERELEIKTNNLEEANIALKVLLKKRDEDKTELEEKVLLNIKELGLPYLEKLKKSGLDETQKTYANILQSNLNEIASSFVYRLSSKFFNLTPTEIHVANLVRQGKMNKEIAELLNFSPRTAAFHRESIRKKLGIKNKKTNLRTYLSSLP